MAARAVPFIDRYQLRESRRQLGTMGGTMTIPVQLTAEQERMLQEAANRLNISPESLASAAVRDLLSHGSTEFQQAADRVLDKNRELYRRLA